MSTVGTVEKALAAALYADGDQGLDTGASLLAADPATDAELRLRGEEFVRRAWERGWQPADVVRIVRRDLDEPHERLVAELITGESGRYAHLAPRWRAQLDELKQAPYTADRFSCATAVLELYRLLVRLPAIEPVGPVPGAPFTAEPSPHEPRMLTRIRALLAKAEATGFPQEAEALTAKAQELMARHSVDEAVLAAQTHRPDVPAACRIGVDAPYETAKAILLDAVASANRCRAVWNSGFGFSTVVGFEADLEGVELLYTSLLVQGTSAMTRAEATQRAGGRKRTKTFRQSFLMAYASRLGERLAVAADAVTDAVTADGGRDLLPVLAARDVAVTDRAERMFPETTTTRVRGVNDEAGWTHGRAAADSAQVSKTHPRITP
ncbi:DUF2786 domain-containing protein [Streptomyces lunaelactis]|uniref:DUF2786 domain-containing protein n=1 Tax=Streptomyces lunaelactis TaxID=1535768 RepID=UPI0015852F1C|nr:DUF2786 domain-containing protein [Streptomyces lunaelactis]NUK07268.1 DUF2786 domain-containing protein [Streptomyces lunaelactis]NUL11337.1 DUF2786 domain-containing protein [Streptomyces lunaelactis]NUL23862.1 DUF2786 domain-containing protein [Streptomyces lunaelactis]